MILSVGVLVGIGLYLAREYRQTQKRAQLADELKQVFDEDGPCVALERMRALPQPFDAEGQNLVEGRRRASAAAVLGSADRAGQSAFLAAEAEGLIDRSLCEQIRLAYDLGELHPLMELLRYTREAGDPCEQPEALEKVLAGLSTHKREMLHALMKQVTRLQCLPPFVSGRISEQVLTLGNEIPNAFDDLEVLRVAKFLNSWAPVEAAQFACRAEAERQPSALAAAIGCTGYSKRQVLPRYRLNVAVAADGLAPAIPAQSEVLLLQNEGERCLVLADVEPPRTFQVGCRDMVPLSDVEVAVLIEKVSYGLVRASLISGLASYVPQRGTLEPSRKEPDLKSWYGYSRDGEALGLAQLVNMKDLATKLGEDVPKAPLRAFCHQSGARYCYDVDWSQVVDYLEGDAVVFLSRPTPVLLTEGAAGTEQAALWQRETLGEVLAPNAVVKSFALRQGGALLAVVTPGSLELRFRQTPTGPWQSQTMGLGEGGSFPPIVRLLAVLDLQSDGKPELIVQRVKRGLASGVAKDLSDEIVLLSLDASGRRFSPLNALTVHEY